MKINEKNRSCHRNSKIMANIAKNLWDNGQQKEAVLIQLINSFSQNDMEHRKAIDFRIIFDELTNKRFFSNDSKLEEYFHYIEYAFEQIASRHHIFNGQKFPKNYIAPKEILIRNTDSISFGTLEENYCFHKKTPRYELKSWFRIDDQKFNNRGDGVHFSVNFLTGEMKVFYYFYNPAESGKWGHSESSSGTRDLFIFKEGEIGYVSSYQKEKKFNDLDKYQECLSEHFSEFSKENFEIILEYFNTGRKIFNILPEYEVVKYLPNVLNFWAENEICKNFIQIIQKMDKIFTYNPKKEFGYSNSGGFWDYDA